jgi:hypothetical protein
MLKSSSIVKRSRELLRRKMMFGKQMIVYSKGLSVLNMQKDF